MVATRLGFNQKEIDSAITWAETTEAGAARFPRETEKLTAIAAAVWLPGMSVAEWRKATRRAYAPGPIILMLIYLSLEAIIAAVVRALWRQMEADAA